MIFRSPARHPVSLRLVNGGRPGQSLPQAMDWHPDALARLKKAPFFVRPFIRQRAEREASLRGLSQVTPELLDQLKAKEHRGQHP